jgi:hypothetical protein
MTVRSSQVSVDASPAVVRRILLEASALAEWNPAFLSIQAPETAAAGQRYPIRTRGGLSGYLEYRDIADERIVGHWEVPGLSEDHVWELRAAGGRTEVRHSFEHRGLLAAVLRAAFADVAQMRLDRLAQRAAARAHGARDGHGTA